MTIEYVRGDILTQHDGLIIQGCNSMGVQGSGLALSIKTKYPQVYEAYMKHPMGIEALGSFQVVQITDKLYIGNCFSQLNYGREVGKKYASPQAIRKSVDAAYFWCDIHKKTLHSPKIGCQLGGLSWEDDVQPIFEALYNKYKVRTIIYEL